MQDQNIERGIGVQIAGDGNSVTIYAGRSELVLDFRHKLKSAPRNERELLLTELRATTLVGRDDDLAALGNWLSPPAPISVRCLTGRAGTGKTRLAIELCERIETDGWTAGFASYTELERFCGDRDLRQWRWPNPTLVVVDYAAASAHRLRTWFETLARQPLADGQPPLRILLLERHADSQAGWWADLIRPAGLSGRGPDAFADPPEPIALPSLRAVEDRRALLEQVLHDAARLHEPPCPAPPLPDPGENPEFDRRLADDAINNEPLYLVMAGLVGVTTGAPAALALSRTDLAHRVAESERARLERFARGHGLDPDLIAHLAACATLEGGCDAEAAARMIGIEQAAMNFTAAMPPETIAWHLADALPVTAGAGIDAIRPDLVGEAFLLQELQRNKRSVPKQVEIVERAYNRAGSRVVATVIHTAQDHANDNPIHASLCWFDCLATLSDDPLSLLNIANELPEKTLVLRERAAELYKRIIKAFSDSLTTDPEVRCRLAAAFNNHAAALSELGRHEDALIQAQQSAKLFHALAEEQPNAFAADLAMSLNTLAAIQRGSGGLNDALAAAHEALTLYRDLAAQRPDMFRPKLATALNNIAAMFSGLGQREEAVNAAMEAVALYRDLVKSNPETYTSYLAGTLNTLAVTLRELGRRDEALKAVEESVALNRNLAARHPDAGVPDLVMSLCNQANSLVDLGRNSEGLIVAQEAIGLYRNLTARYPAPFRGFLIGALNNLASIMNELGRHEEALPVIREAAILCRDLFKQHPEAFKFDFSVVLHTLANTLYMVGQHEEALAVVQEAIEIRRDLAARHPDAGRPELALSLAVLANCLDALGNSADALTVNAEAVENLADAFIRHPTAFLNWMRPMMYQYLRRCIVLQQTPDVQMVIPLIEVLNDRSSGRLIRHSEENRP